MNRPVIPSQQARENPEPHEASNPMPWYVIAVCAALLAFGVAYIAGSSPMSRPEFGDGRLAAELTRSASAPGGARVDGASVFASRCAPCHQPNGAGLPGVFPPLAGSEWVRGDPELLAALVLHGISGALTVRGTVYHGTMPAFGPQLGDAELAAVLSHVRAEWGNAAPAVRPQAVAAARAATSGRAGPFGGDAELASWRARDR